MVHICNWLGVYLFLPAVALWSRHGTASSLCCLVGISGYDHRRGFLQPQLQKRLPIAHSTFITGTIWAVWHIPLWFIPGTHQQTDLNFLWFLINAAALSFLLAAIYNGTRSIFLCILFHAFTNAFWDIIPPSYEFLPIIIVLILSYVFSLITIKYCRSHCQP